jgi:hypothetical protein
MIIRMRPQLISKHWPELRAQLERALPPFTYGDPARMNNMLAELLNGGMQLWVALAEREGTPGAVYVGVMATTISEDECSRVRNLLVYALAGVRFMADEIWAAGLAALRKFAAAQGCHRIVAFSDSERVVEQWQRLGGAAQYRFLTLEV